MPPAKDPAPRHTPLAQAKDRDYDRGRDNDRSTSSSSSSAAVSAAVIASPPTENEGTSPPRQKRWATKTRTGCITCRYVISSSPVFPGGGRCTGAPLHRRPIGH
ncbi:hypothetical protein V2A60_009836 [Cordyceps javanica]